MCSIITCHQVHAPEANVSRDSSPSAAQWQTDWNKQIVKSFGLSRLRCFLCLFAVWVGWVFHRGRTVDIPQWVFACQPHAVYMYAECLHACTRLIGETRWNAQLLNMWRWNDPGRNHTRTLQWNHLLLITEQRTVHMWTQPVTLFNSNTCLLRFTGSLLSRH